MQIRRSFSAGAASATALLLLVGCASPGVPRPPSLHLPAPVRDLSALRVGSGVELHFTTPEETTDHQTLSRKGVPFALTAVVCRVQGATCLIIARITPMMPGQALTTVDTLPPPLTVGPGRAVAYRVRVQNPAGRDAGLSRDALAAAGAAPPAITGLAATTAAEGIQLTWQAAPGEQSGVRVEAVVDAGVLGPPPSGKTPPSAAAAAASHARLLQVPPGRRDPGGAIDSAPSVGVTTTYHVYREREVTVNGQVLPLRGGSATVTAVRAADVFAPAAPLGVLAVSFSSGNAGVSVSLSWEPNGELDLAGYQVYRAVGKGAYLRVTPQPVAGVSFQDTAQDGLKAGTHVRYVVTAVDRNGNESARSAVTEVDVR